MLSNMMSHLKKLQPFSATRSPDTFDDPDHSTEERRFITIGTSENGRILVIGHTDDGETVRIINAREPTKGERSFYEESQS
jgi:uncharacterized DUF497 family protein